ncbi:MAG: hypothetical protein U1E67_04605 [Hyphomicrobiales bacterium]
MRRAAFNRRRAVFLFSAFPLLIAPRRASSQEEQTETLGLEADNPLQPIAANYQSLGSYQDKGTVVTRYQWPGTPLLEEHHRFETAFRVPRNFFFRFDADPASGGDVYVIWCDGGPFQSWWKATGTHTVHDNGQGAVAFFTGQQASKDAANLVAPFFFPQADLVGPAYRLIPPVTQESGTLDERICRKISAAERVSGSQTREHRPTTVWVDDETLLIRKVVIGPDAGSDPKLIDEKTFIVDAQANPELPDSRFTFTPPE